MYISLRVFGLISKMLGVTIKQFYSWFWMIVNRQTLCEVLTSHSGLADVSILLRCYTLQSGKYLMTMVNYKPTKRNISADYQVCRILLHEEMLNVLC
jgi:hypothetical protein